jgi:hypothetical protein
MAVFQHFRLKGRYSFLFAEPESLLAYLLVLLNIYSPFVLSANFPANF